jgi:hypothetical protein
LANGTLTVYLAGTTTLTNTWQDYQLTSLNTNPVVLDSRGECVLWLDSAITYKFILKNSSGVVQWTQDNLIGANAASAILEAALSQPTGSSKVGGSDQIVSSIAALRALLKTSSSKNAYVTGYYAAGDGGGGAYYYDATDTTTAENGGTIIVASDGGRWKLASSASVNVKVFGAKGDEIADDAPAIRAAIAVGYATQASVLFPAGIYKIGSPITIPGQVYLRGEGGFNTSCLVGASSAIFTYASMDLCRFEKLSFRASVAGCMAFKQTTLTSYTSNCVWKDCDFFYSLTECIYGNLIICTIDGNAFGYHGPAAPSQTAHRHIYSKGDSAGGSTTNINRISNNKFYNANGVTESCYFESGYRLNIYNNVYETNISRALTLAGMHDISISQNWFENNSNQYVIALTNNTANTIGNYVCDINNNEFVSNFSGAYIALVSGSSVISSFSFNSGTGSFFQVTPGNTQITKSESNYFTGSIALPINFFADGTWTPTQGSGLTVIGTFSSSGIFTRIGKQVTITANISASTSVAFPNTGAILCGGLPISVGSQGMGSGTNGAQTISYSVLAASSSIYGTTTISATPSLQFTCTYTI